MSLPYYLPRTGDFSSFWQNPFVYLRAARAKHGNIVCLSEDLPVFSRATRCSGSVAVFGEELTRAVLSDLDTFGMPVSVSDRYTLPPPLSNLNSGLFSMQGDRHRDRQRVLAAILSPASAAANVSAIAHGCRSFFESWHNDLRLNLISEMRRFTLHIFDRLLFGDAGDDILSIGRDIQRFFELRRDYAAWGANPSIGARSELIFQGQRVDRLLRERMHRYSSDTKLRTSCVLGRLLEAKSSQGEQLDEDELVAHGNILFMASSEPVATALTWTLLVLTQVPSLREGVRLELEKLRITSDVALPGELDKAPLLHGVVYEALRLLPPSAILVRLSRRTTELDGYLLPAGCELVLSPWAAHRDPDHFPKPDVFEPHRWVTTQPKPFQFFPFGAGVRACLGRHLATYIIKLALSQILARYDPVLAHDQEIDWRMNLTLLPSQDPVVVLRQPHSFSTGGVLGGPTAELFRFDA